MRLVRESWESLWWYDVGLPTGTGLRLPNVGGWAAMESHVMGSGTSQGVSWHNQWHVTSSCSLLHLWFIFMKYVFSFKGFIEPKQTIQFKSGSGLWFILDHIYLKTDLSGLFVLNWQLKSLTLSALTLSLNIEMSPNPNNAETVFRFRIFKEEP